MLGLLFRVFPAMLSVASDFFSFVFLLFFISQVTFEEQSYLVIQDLLK